jgi:hypothetical protein
LFVNDWRIPQEEEAIVYNEANYKKDEGSSTLAGLRRMAGPPVPVEQQDWIERTGFVEQVVIMS